jgi:hypothetical protein
MTTNKMLKAVGAAALTVAMSTSIAMAQTAPAPFSDVPTNHWAYAAIQQLQADGLIEGYPGGYFKGNRPLTRYELAVAVARLDKSVKDKLAALQVVTPADLAALRKLEDEFKVELDGVKKDLAGVKSDVATLKTQVAAQQATLDRQKFKLYYFLRAPGTYRDYVAGYAADGTALPTNTLLTGPSNGAGNQSLRTGENHYGTGYQVVRIRFDGVVDPKVSYSIRLEDRYYLANAPGNGPENTSSNTPGFGSFPNNSSFRLNWANLTYKDPSGLYATVGRFAESSGDIGLSFSDYFNGAELGYAKDKLAAFVGYSFNKASESNTTPVTNAASQTLFARVQLNATKKLTVGASWINDLSDYAGLTGYNPATGLLAAYNPNIAIGSIDAIYAFSPKFSVEAEGLQRFGKDPFTGSNWDGKNAYWVKAFLGDTAPKSGNSYLDAGFIYAGLNSTGPHNEVEGTPDYQQFFVGNPNGYQIGYVGVHRYVGANTQVGLVYQGYTLRNDLHVNTSLGLPGAILRHDDANALFLETKLAF